MNTARAAMEALVRGAITFTKVCHWLQPSRYAASAISSGIPMYACLRKKVPKALTMPGNTRAKMVLVSPNFASIWYWGVMKIWEGSIICTSTRENIRFLPLKFSFAKA